MGRAVGVGMIGVMILILALAVGTPRLQADTYTNTFTNTSTKQWIAWHIECTNVDSVNYKTVDAYNTSAPSPKWRVYFFEQGSNFYQRKGFLVYPADDSGTEIDPGETLSITFTFTPTAGATPSFTQYPVEWPLDGDLVIVTPENMESLGWSIATNSGAKAGIVPYGPGVWEANRALVAEEYNIHLGKGSFYAELDYSGGPGSTETPATAWLGLDSFGGQPLAGIPLKRIKTMKYFCFQSKIPTRTTHPSSWESWNAWWIYPRQPICLELTAESPDGSGRLQFWFRPWSTSKVSGDNSGRQNRRWLWYDCINGTPQVQVTRRWYVYRGLAEDGVTSLDQVFDSWSELVAVYGDWKLVSTSNDPWPIGYKSAGWDETTDPPGSPTCTATGKCLNFVVGARKGQTHIYGPDNDYQLNVVNWAGYYWGLRGNLDFFTLGIDLNGDGDDADPGERITYNFEPSPADLPLRKVATNQEATYDRIMGVHVRQGSHEWRLVDPVLNYCPTMICGKVTKINNVCFELDDGSNIPMKTRVYLIRNLYNYYDSASGYTFPATGQYWCVWGWLEKPRFFPDVQKPLCLWTNIFNCKRLK